MATIPRADYGFRFWLGWIFWFAASFLTAALFWTWLIRILFGAVLGAELTLTWSLAVFGSWFVLLIPFMRQKERIWKRLNADQENALSAWFFAMGFFIGVLILSALGWSYIYRRQILESAYTGWNRPWIKAVLSTWLLSLLPFLIWMYRRADAIFKLAVERQAPRGPDHRSLFVERSKRLLPEKMAEKLRDVKPLLGQGHVLTLVLKDGTRVPHVFVMNAKEILGIYDRDHFDFTAGDVEDIEPLTAGQLPAYEESKWLRLDGRV